ncbi:MAG: hypothetical protein V2A70_08940 [Candidatus Omnitrophota bacterium]
MKKMTSLLAVVSFMFNCVMPVQGLAQTISAVDLMSQPGEAVALTKAFVPAHLSGLIINPNEPFHLDFVVYRGDEALTAEQKQVEYLKLIKYFLAALAVPDKDQWVNLSPYEKDRIIPDTYGMTAMGRDVLAQDYMLKQMASSLINPETDLGKQFWDGVYAKAYKEFGTTNIPTDVFNKVWIMSGKAVIYESGNKVSVLEHHLKVMLESDYVAATHNVAAAAPADSVPAQELSKKVFRDVILPAIEKEVNEGQNFAPLRQVQDSMLLAAWYKRALRESILSKVYADRVKVNGINQDPKENEAIYEQYVAAFKKGVFNMIKEDVDPKTNEVNERKYFSGGVEGAGMSFDDAAMVTKAMSGPLTSAALDALALKEDIVKVVFKDPGLKAGEVTQGNMDNAAKASQINNNDFTKGGVDFAQSGFEMLIRRDGNGVPLPYSRQSLDSFRIDGLFPVILSIQAASSLPTSIGAKGAPKGM